MTVTTGNLDSECEAQVVQSLRRLKRIPVRVQETQAQVVVLDLSAVFDLEYPALTMLIEADKTTRGVGQRLWLAPINPDVFSMIKKFSLGGTLGREGMHLNLESAVAKYFAATSGCFGGQYEQRREQSAYPIRQAPKHA